MTGKIGRPPAIQVDYNYLYHNYIERNLSTVEIAKKLDCDPGSVRYRLKKFKINLRGLSESHLSGYNFSGSKEVLYGSLLGDASLIKRNKNGSVSLSKSNINFDHVYHVGEQLLGCEPTKRIRQGVNDCGNLVFKFTMKCCDYFLNEHALWYDEEKVKRIPKDLDLTPLVALHWFLDDGHSTWKNKQKTRIEVGLSTESFTEEDCNFLRSKFDGHDISTGLAKSHGGFGYKIRIKAKSIMPFFDFIGPCPVKSMQYKWKLHKPSA